MEGGHCAKRKESSTLRNKRHNIGTEKFIDGRLTKELHLHLQEHNYGVPWGPVLFSQKYKRYHFS